MLYGIEKTTTFTAQSVRIHTFLCGLHPPTRTETGEFQIGHQLTRLQPCSVHPWQLLLLALSLNIGQIVWLSI